MVGFADIVSGGQFRADLQNMNRVTQTEWVILASEAILDVWRRAASARPDFQVRPMDVTVATGPSASFATPPNFYGEIDLVYGPDTQGEYSLGPYAWQNRRAPGAWWPPFTVNSAIGGTRARLMGNSIYIEPAMRAGGIYRLWYCPKPTICSFFVRVATTGALPSCTASGSGVGKTLTATANGALTVDGVAVVAGDRVLVQNQVAAVDDGIYAVTNPGSGGTQWVLTRAVDFDQAATDGVYAGVVAMPTEGTVNTNQFFQLLAFGTNGLGTIDVDTQAWGTAMIDQVLWDFAELIKIKTAITAINRDDRSPGNWLVTAQALEGELTTFFRQVRTSNVPSKMVDTDQMGPRTFPWGGGW